MPLPNKLLSQRPRGAAASGSCCFRVSIHPGRVWLGDTKIDQWRNSRQAVLPSQWSCYVCSTFSLLWRPAPFLLLLEFIVSSWLIWIWLSKYCLLVHQSPIVFRNEQPKELWCFHRIPRFYKLFWVPWTVNHQYLGSVRRWFWSHSIQKYLLNPYPGSWQSEGQKG